MTYAAPLKWLMLLTLFASPVWGGDFPADRLHILAKVDGTDELHLSPLKAKWAHKAMSLPTDIKINGLKWNVQQSPELAMPSGAALLRPDLELCGAVLHKLRGRGSVKLGCDRDGLIVRFDDPDGGADTYEVTIDFARALAEKRAPSKSEKDLQWNLKAKIDGLEEVWLHQDLARWVHKENQRPVDVTINGQAWDTVKDATFALQPELQPETMDLQHTTIKKVAGRGIVSLDYVHERLAICLEDHGGGSDRYEVLLRVPRFRKRHLVSITADVPDAILGANLKIYRFPEEDDKWSLLAGQRCFGTQGRCLVALEPGEYQFEVLHKPTADTLVALKTSQVRITGAKKFELRAQRINPRFHGPQGQVLSLDDLQIRSARKTGAISWKAPANSEAAALAVWLSQNQSYQIHAFGRKGNDYAAVWKTLAAPKLAEITLDKRQWLACSFHWKEGTPRASGKGVVLGFPDGQMEIPEPESARFFTNRQFFSVSYWLAFPGKLRASFLPRGRLVSAMGDNELWMGGPLRPVASAAILEDESLSPRGARHLWWDIALADSQDDLLDVAGSKLDWKSKLTTRGGEPVKTKPLSGDDIRSLGNVTETLLASATFRMESEQTVSVYPEAFVSHKTPHCSTRAPPYHDWNTRTYLTKAEREINLIAAVLHQPLAANRHIDIKWWFNTGAVGGNNSVTMPISTYLKCRDWYSHTWAIAHEMLHNFGYGHTQEMERLDHEVQDGMEQFRWHVADHPEYVPEEWVDLPGQ
ncbi:MAG TPA: hypothetical protein VGH74_22725 [Planctomycetaceae bacterium]